MKPNVSLLVYKILQIFIIVVKDVDVYEKLLKKYNKATKEQQEEIRKSTRNAINNFQNVYEQMCKNMK